jgi:hypothetical protein
MANPPGETGTGITLPSGSLNLLRSESMRGAHARIYFMLTIWRRHTNSCPHRTRGRNVLKCNCPLWADGYIDGKRTLRQSLGTRDMARARKKAVALESPNTQTFKAVDDAVAGFLDHCNSEGLKISTVHNTATR